MDNQQFLSVPTPLLSAKYQCKQDLQDIAFSGNTVRHCYQVNLTASPTSTGEGRGRKMKDKALPQHKESLCRHKKKFVCCFFFDKKKVPRLLLLLLYGKMWKKHYFSWIPWRRARSGNGGLVSTSDKVARSPLCQVYYYITTQCLRRSRSRACAVSDPSHYTPSPSPFQLPQLPQPSLSLSLLHSISYQHPF